MKTIAVLPSRFAASRFPGKPLSLILGKPMIQWVWDAARSAPGVNRVIIATDDERIQSAVHEFDGEAVMTDPALPSGTDRVAAALALLDESFDVVLNIQGDEPAIHPQTIAAVVELMARHPEFPIGTAACAFASMDEVFNPNAVKVVADDHHRALYFSRSPIPYVRHSKIFDCDFRSWAQSEHLPQFRRHLGIYAYRPEALKTFMTLPPHPLERIEMLEQLRALASGMAIGVAETPFISLGVDTPEDVAAVETLLQQRAAM